MMPKDKPVPHSETSPDMTDLFEAALRTGRLATWETDFVSGTRTWTIGAAEIFGIEVDVAVPVHFDEKDHLREVMHPDDRHMLDDYRDVLMSEDEIEVAYRINRADTGIRHLAGRGRVVKRNADGTPVRAIHIIQDVTARHEVEAHNALLMRELSHRTKNLLTVVAAMSRQTSRHTDTIEEFQNTFHQRLDGLARSINLLVEQDWSSTQLEDLIRSQLETFVIEQPDRLVLEGPRVRIDAGRAQAVGMALHELATNAMKHGALSTADGYIRIEWSVEQPKDGPAMLNFQWREYDGPPVEAPPRKGFGSTVLTTMTAGALNTTITYEMLPKGVLWAFRAEL